MSSIGQGELRRHVPVLILGSLMMAGCGARTHAAEPEPQLPLYRMIFTTTSVSCTPYEGWSSLETEGGEVVSGIEVCAEFIDACHCESAEQVREGTAVIEGSAEGGCWSWSIVEATFWAYASGTVCEADGGWTLLVDSYDGAECGFIIEPQMHGGGLSRMEMGCNWMASEGSVIVQDRVFLQRLHED